MQILLPSQLPAGTLALEVQRGSFMGPELPLLVAPTLTLAQDALSLLQKTVPADRQGLTIDLGFIMSSSSTCPAVASVLLVRSASQLLVRAVQHGLVELTRMLMGVVVKERADVLSRIRGPSGMGLVHLAVRTGSSAVLGALLEPVNASAWRVSPPLLLLRSCFVAPRQSINLSLVAQSRAILFVVVSNAAGMTSLPFFNCNISLASVTVMLSQVTFKVCCCS